MILFGQFDGLACPAWLLVEFYSLLHMLIFLQHFGQVLVGWRVVVVHAQFDGPVYILCVDCDADHGRVVTC